MWHSDNGQSLIHESSIFESHIQALIYRPSSLFQFISKCIALEDIWCKDHLWKMTMTLISSKAHTLHCTGLHCLHQQQQRGESLSVNQSCHCILYFLTFFTPKNTQMSVNFLSSLFYVGSTWFLFTFGFICTEIIQLWGR